MTLRNWTVDDFSKIDIPEVQTLWIVVYMGNSGTWQLSSHFTYKENAEKLAQIYASSGRQVYILEYRISEVHDVPFVVKKIKKVRKVRKVVE